MGSEPWISLQTMKTTTKGSSAGDFPWGIARKTTLEIQQFMHCTGNFVTKLRRIERILRGSKGQRLSKQNDTSNKFNADTQKNEARGRLALLS